MSTLAPLTNTPSMSAYGTPKNPGFKDNTSETKSSERNPAVKVTLTSNATLSPSAKAVDDLLNFSGTAIFENAFKSLKSYLPNLATVLDDPKATLEAQNAANEAMQAREQAAFGDAVTTGALEYARAYIEYYDSLSPEEQNSDRYRGTRENMVGVANRAAADAGKDVGDLSKSQDPISMLFEKIRQNAFKLNEENTEAFIEDYRQQVGGLISADDQADTIEAAIGRFREVQGTIENARLGDDAAFAQLTALSLGSMKTVSTKA